MLLNEDAPNETISHLRLANREEIGRIMKIAAFTMVYNDSIFLPIWWQYYGRAFGTENLFVLDHGSDDGSPHSLGRTHVLLVPRSKHYDEDDRAALISRCQTLLLSYYDAVVFSDVDEILIADPAKFSSLSELIEQKCDQFINAVGLDLYQLPDVESDIDLTRPILAQRNYVRFSALSCKPLISRIPLAWSPGFHACNYAPSINRDLYMFHLKCMDRKLALSRLKTTRAISWSENAHAKGHGKHHRLADNAFLAQMFLYSADNIGQHLRQGFDFSDDLDRCEMTSPNQFNDYRGAFALIPQRFRYLIDGTAAEQPANLGGHQKVAPCPGTKARRALQRMINMNAVRDRCRHMVNFLYHKN